MDYLGLALRWLHILPAVALAGGVIFMRFPLAPAVAGLDEASRENLQLALRRRWSKVVMITSALIIVTGLYNAVNIIRTQDPSGMYHGLVALKLLLALGLMMISSLLAGRTSLADKLRANASLWLNVNLALAVALVLVGGLMRGTPRNEAEPETEQAAAAQLLQPHNSELGEFTPWIRKTRNG